MDTGIYRKKREGGPSGEPRGELGGSPLEGALSIEGWAVAGELEMGSKGGPSVPVSVCDCV